MYGSWCVPPQRRTFSVWATILFLCTSRECQVSCNSRTITVGAVMNEEMRKDRFAVLDDVNAASKEKVCVGPVEHTLQRMNTVPLKPSQRMNIVPLNESKQKPGLAADEMQNITASSDHPSLHHPRIDHDNRSVRKETSTFRMVISVSAGLVFFGGIISCLVLNLRVGQLDDMTEAEKEKAQQMRMAADPWSELQLGNYDSSMWVSLTQLCRVNARGSIFRNEVIVRQIFGTLFMTLIIILMVLPMNVDHNLEDDIATCSGYMNGFLPFFFGMYLKTLIGRWWSARTGGVGGQINAIIELCQILATGVSNERVKKAETLMLRYGLLGFDLTFMQARKEVDFQELVDKGYLEAGEERETLERIHKEKGNAAQAVWVWIASMWSILDTTKAVHKRQAARALKLISSGKAAVRSVAAHVTCQVPMAWVHIIATMVYFSIMALCGDCALAISSILKQRHFSSDILRNAGVATNLGPLFSLNYEDMVRMLVEILKLLCIPCVYGGFLALGNELMNPFGREHSCFPRIRYLNALFNEGKGVKTCAENLPLKVKNVPMKGKPGPAPAKRTSTQSLASVKGENIREEDEERVSESDEDF